jgi:hypothetical protein
MDKLLNANVKIELRENGKKIFGEDLKDHNNLPAFYNVSKRGLKKAWEALVKAFNPNMGMYDAIQVLRDNGIKCHSWCMMD